MPAAVAKLLVTDPRNTYANLETLTGSGVRRAPAPEHDRHRRAVAALLFGIFGERICYGALSLNEHGLPTYGEIHCRLRDIAVQDRATFLETNSYRFVREKDIKPGARIPPGFRAAWDNRGQLALAKLVGSLQRKQTAADWQAILIKPDARDRSNDEFIEAHIYESFDINAVEEMVQVVGKRLSRDQRMDAKIALEKFRQARGGKP